MTLAETGDIHARLIAPAQSAAINMNLLRRPILMIFLTLYGIRRSATPPWDMALTVKAAFIGPDQKLQVQYRNSGCRLRIFAGMRSPKTGENEGFSPLWANNGRLF